MLCGNHPPPPPPGVFFLLAKYYIQNQFTTSNVFRESAMKLRFSMCGGESTHGGMCISKPSTTGSGVIL